MAKAIRLQLAPGIVLPDGVDGKTFQLHLGPSGGGDALTLYEVTLDKDLARCPVVVGGERCGMGVGHAGKHCWAGGD